MSSYDFLTSLRSSLGDFDLSNHGSVTSTAMSVNIAFIIVVTLTMSLRMYVRFGMLHAAGLDDGECASLWSS